MQTKPDLKSWGTLYDLTIKLKQLKPWEYLWDNNIIQIELPNYQEPFYISVLGRAKETYGIVVYPGQEGLASYFNMYTAQDLGISPLYTMSEQTALTCYFGNRDEVFKEQYEIIRALDLRFRGRNQWPYFLSMKPKFTPYLLDNSEVEQLSAIYEALINLLNVYQTGDIKVDFDNHEVIVQYYDQDSRSWKQRIGKLDAPQTKLPTFQVSENDSIVQNLLHLPINNTVLEIDMHYMNAVIPGDELGLPRPFNPKILVLLDQKTQLIMDHAFIDPTTNEPDVIINNIIKSIQEFGRPKAIHFKQPLIGVLLRNLCLNIQIPLIQSKHLPASEAYFTDLMNQLINDE